VRIVPAGHPYSQEEIEMAKPSEPNEMLVVAYPSEGEADQVLKALQQLDHEHVVQLKNAAVVVRDRAGKISLRETHDFDAKQGAIVGALAGGLIGKLTGGSVLGEAALGAVGGVAVSRVIDLGFNDAYLREVGANLPPGSSALVAVVHFDHLDQALQTLQQFPGGHVMRLTLPLEIQQQVQQAMQGL
jgi:uncharacterized membrane protein